MSQMTQPELQSLHTLLWMEAAMYEKFQLYREQAKESAAHSLFDQLIDRSRQHVTALGELLDANVSNDG